MGCLPGGRGLWPARPHEVKQTYYRCDVPVKKLSVAGCHVSDRGLVVDAESLQSWRSGSRLPL